MGFILCKVKRQSLAFLPNYRNSKIHNISLLTLSLYLGLLLRIVNAQESIRAPNLMRQNPCSSKQTCHECIQMPTCAWCSDPAENANKIRCFQPTILSKHCKPQYIIDPDNINITKMGRALTKAGEGQEAVQISPQRVHLKLRAYEPYKLHLQYAQAEDYPIDLYCMMDLSKSMEDDKDKLSDLGALLAESMGNISSNFRLGFGSFVDKVVMPYVSTVPKKLKEPCSECVAPYGFRNHMPLSSNISRFSGEVRKAEVSGNLDAPEGGFDAIMQAVVCKEEIGWSDNARRLLLFSTDDLFHYAGDGKLGGIVKPNDGLCHLDENGMYTHSTLQDYPSVSELNTKVRVNAINLIFAVTAKHMDIYEQLKDNVEGASIGQLSNDSSNIVELVKEQYGKISSSVVMKDNATGGVKVTYFSSCLGSGPLKKTNKCEGVKVGNVITFIAEIEFTKCSKNPEDWKQTFGIHPIGINESLIVDLELQCNCPCENTGDPGYVENAAQCSGHGTYMCGICTCDSLHFGRKCECGAPEEGGEGIGWELAASAGCRPDNTTYVECSGRGVCICGECECYIRENSKEVISGAYCECDNFSCDRHNGLLCSGPDHGTCDCGKCQCLSGWTGSACDCPTSNDACIGPGGAGEVCSGKGECECGICKCFEEDEGRYAGRFCENCPTCPGRCLEFKECVQCQVYKTGPLTEKECATNCKFLLTTVGTIEVNEKKDESLCSYYDDDNCRFAFVYGYGDDGIVYVRAQEKKECPHKAYVAVIVAGLIGAIMLIGMLMLLLWKLLTTIHDRREFAKFEKERQSAFWVKGNPLYKKATSTFKNPTYAGN